MKSITDVREDLLRKVHLVHPCKELVLVVHSGQEHQLHEGSHCTSSDLPLCHGVSGFPSNLINFQGYHSILLSLNACHSLPYCRGTKDDLGMVQGTVAGMEEAVK